MKTAVKWEVKELNGQRSIQLFDEQGNKIEGIGAHWEDCFDCSSDQLTSLEGAPQTVGGDFYCYDNNLTSLKGAPQTVGGDFSCCYNQLTSLEGAPETVGGGFYCYDNNLTSLKGAPQTVGGDFNCCSSNQLTSLEGAPEAVGGGFYCYDNNLTSLDGAPQAVGGSFYCHDNNLTSLEGAPEAVGGGFYCYDNNLTSLEGAPQTYQLEKVQEILLKRGILFQDGIMASVIKKKGHIFKIKKVGSNVISWCVTDGENWSHGYTLREAHNDLIFKNSVEDTSQFKNWNITEKRQAKDLILAYRSITRACSFGVKEFCKSLDLSKRYSVEDVFQLTEGQYQHEVFRGFFK